MPNAPSLNPQHPMTQFGSENAIKFIALIIWKLRAHCPNLAITITVEDTKQLNEVFMANNQMAVVACRGLPQGVELQLVDQQTGQALVLDKALDENSHNARMMARCLEARKKAPALADKLTQFRNKDNTDLVREAAEVLRLLTWEPEQ